MVLSADRIREKFGFAPSYNGNGKPPSLDDVIAFFRADDVDLKTQLEGKNRVGKLFTDAVTYQNKLAAEYVEAVKDDQDHLTRLKSLDTPEAAKARADNIARIKALLAATAEKLKGLSADLTEIQNALNAMSATIQAAYTAYIGGLQAEAQAAVVVEENLKAQMKLADDTDKVLAMGDAVLAGILTYQAVANGPKILAMLAEALRVAASGTANTAGELFPG